MTPRKKAETGCCSECFPDGFGIPADLGGGEYSLRVCEHGEWHNGTVKAEPSDD
jgi:hypothetical protein